MDTLCTFWGQVGFRGLGHNLTKNIIIGPLYIPLLIESRGREGPCAWAAGAQPPLPLLHAAGTARLRLGVESLPAVSIVVPFGGLSYTILHIKMVKPKKGNTMETIGRV